MNWLVMAGVVLGAMAALVTLVGAGLPRAHIASREVRLPAPPDAVWHAITDVEAYTGWRADVSRVERLPESGGATWVEHGRNGRITFTVDRAEPPRLLVVRIADRDLPFGGTWTYEISPAAEGSTLTVTERGEVYNPIFRFMARFVFGHDASLNSYLAALERKLAHGTSRS